MLKKKSYLKKYLQILKDKLRVIQKEEDELINMNPIKNLIVYQSQNNDNISVEVLYDNEDFWLTQKSMSKLFDVEVNSSWI